MSTDTRAEDFKIVLHPSSPEGELNVYNPGSEVTGTLFVDVSTPRQYNSIVINLLGEGHVQWTKTTIHITPSNGISNFYTTVAIRKADRVYVNLTKSLWNKSETSDGNLPPGQHSFPFHFVLPQGIPSSHESELRVPHRDSAYGRWDKGSGWTRYTLCGRIKHRGHQNDQIIQTSLTIKEIIDINTPQLQLPVSLCVRKTPFCFCCVSGPVTATLDLPKTGYCVGEDIPYHITIENGGSESVVATVSLEEHISYHTRFRKCYPEVILHGRVDNGLALPGQTTTLTPEVQVLNIPTSVIATRNSSIIKQSFILKVKVRVPYVIFNPVLICPLTISNPHRREEPRLPSVEVDQVIPSLNASSPPSAPNYPIPPPSSNSIPPGVPIQHTGDTSGIPIQHTAGTSGASILLTTEPPSYRDAIKKY